MKCLKCKLFLFISLTCILSFLPIMAQEHWLSELQQKAAEKRSSENPPLKCGLPILADAYAAEDGATISERARKLRFAKSITADVTYLSPSGHFLIRYDTTGIDAVPAYDRNGDGFPDFIDFVAEAFDRAWEVEIDSLGFRPPPDENGQPLDVYPVLCERLSSGLYGATFFDTNSDIAALTGFNYTSEISINTNFDFVEYPHISNDPILRDSAAIAVTGAHEFNHAIQLGYRIWFRDDNPNSQIADLRYLESTATYMEEVVHDEVNDYYQYLSNFYRNTQRHFGDQIILYGDVIFHIMADDFYGKTITRETWEQIVNEPSIPAMNSVFEAKGSSLNDEFQRLATWMFFSGSNAISGMFFDEAADYPNPNLIVKQPVMLEEDQSIAVHSTNLPSLSFQHIKITAASTGGVSASVTPLNNINLWFATDLFFAPPFNTNFPAGVFTPVKFASPESDIHLAIISGNWDETGNAPPIDYTASLRWTSGDSQNEVLAFPNIIKPGQEAAQITFTNLPSESVIEIFSGNGMRLASVQPESSGQIAFWNLQTDQGNPVASGVYIYRVVSNGEAQSGKIMVIR